MNQFTVKVYELDQNDNRTGNILYQETVQAKSKIAAYDIVGTNIKNNGIHQEYKHRYTMNID